MRICLVSREVYPHVGGGIAPNVAATAQQLAEVAEVTVVTSGNHAAEHRRLVADGDPRVSSAIETLFVPEPDDGQHGGANNHMHAYAVRVHEVLRRRYRDGGPDVLIFGDYMGEGVVTLQAKHTRAAWLDRTLVCVRLHTTSELCAVLDGHSPDDFATEALYEAERYCLRHADRILWGGGDVYATYQRFYGAENLAPGFEMPDAFLDEGASQGDRSVPGDGEVLRLLYLGRLERRKGIHDLVRALLDCGREDWQLTVVGRDTDTGPLGTSLEQQLLLTAAGDPRIRFQDPVPRADVGRLIAAHHVVAVPSRWECWPNVALEALQHNRPIFGTPVGGLTSLAEPGVCGFLAPGTGVQALRDGAVALLDDREAVVEMIGQGRPRARFDELVSPDAQRARYADLAAEAQHGRGAAVTGEPPLVSIVVPYFRMEGLVEETLDAIAAQTYRPIETIVVNDGSLRREDAIVLGRVAERPDTRVIAQVNAGLGAARNLGIAVAAGKYVLPLDSDDLVVAEFVARLVDVMEAAPQLAYCGTFVQYVDEDAVPFGDDLGGYMPYGNWSTLMRRGNVGGVCTCLFRRALFDAGFRYDDELTSYEDWLLLHELHDAGLFGAIIPEKLFLYRVRRASMSRQVGTPSYARLRGEMRARRVEQDMGWTAGALARGAEDHPSPRVLPREAGARPADALEVLMAANAQLAATPDGRRGAAAAAGIVAGAPTAEARA